MYSTHIYMLYKYHNTCYDNRDAGGEEKASKVYMYILYRQWMESKTLRMFSRGLVDSPPMPLHVLSQTWARSWPREA